MKYIIRNCPCYVGYGNELKECGDNECNCADVSDCLLKQIVEKCKKTLNLCKGTDNEFSLGKITYAEFILENFVIQEVEEC